MKFKVGDIVLGTSDYYSITCKGSICQVTEIVENRTFMQDIQVRVLSTPTETDYMATISIDQEYLVDSNFFVKVNSKTANILYGGNKT